MDDTLPPPHDVLIVAVDEVSAEVGYEDASFFRRLFKRRTGLTPKQYRRLFQPLRNAGDTHRTAA